MRTMIDFYLDLPKRFGHKNAFATRMGSGVYQFKTYNELLTDAKNLASGLTEFLSERDKVAIFADNSYEWIQTSIATTLLGAIDVPRASDVTDQDILYILNHSESKVLFVENDTVFEKVIRLEKDLEFLKEIILFYPPKANKELKSKKIRIFTLQELVAKGSENRKEDPSDHLFQNNTIKESDLFTMIYTSGTTGTPKGVMLTHGNILFQLHNLPIRLKRGDKTLSILPIWHIFERIFEIFSLSYGACTYYSSVRTLKEDLRFVKPNFMASAPRLWESIYSGILGTLNKSSRLKQKMFQVSMFFAKIFFHSRQIITGNVLDIHPIVFWKFSIRYVFHLIRFFLVWIPYLVFDFLVLSKIRKATGGELRGSVSGGGALPFHVDEFFNMIGIPVLEGYGMTETAPVLAMRTFEEIIPGSVGKIFPKTQLRLVDLQSGEVFLDTEIGKFVYGRKGEIHVKGKQVMAGYYKNPDATNKVLVDGWLNTGDLGIFTSNHHLRIVGRSKETIVLLGGENVEPVPIESKILESEWIDQCMVVGQDQKFLSALVYPNLNRFDTPVGKNFWNEKEVIQKMESEIKSKINSQTGFKSFERVVGVVVIPKAFEVGDELTAKLSLKRHVITEKYKKEIQSLYD
ncbi:long-chain fatty acid--CoA ligase [Leptospira biflexa]|uniref:AMP-dependent synthetase/ligase n=1 Tax=Leptospira biflexa TaxID=172 RepID=UPI00109107CF|nr:long-chain fatty acid--CoA ligase [Leptospira biflexa]TGM46543.1 long-chain fatty acid--CoA ligase [Leptospira biflexa]TGM50995.1 long-chain fatty acid--CoA ligase [Leptospira biflexa]